MELVALGASGPLVSRVGLGCNNLGRVIDRERSHEVVRAALDAGITFFDTADIYGLGLSEQYLGEALGDRRDQVVIATKFGNDMQGANGGAPGGSREYLRRAFDASLARLGTGVVDVLYYHRPDGVTPLEVTLRAMQELVDEGAVRWLGLSNVDADQIEAAMGLTDEGIGPVVAVQNRYSLVHRADDARVLPACRAHAIGYVPYFPLESGLLTGKYRRGEPGPPGARLTGREDSLGDERFDELVRLEAFAAERSCTLLELAIGGLASIPGIASVIAGATSADQVRANAAAGAFALDASGLTELDAALG